MPVDACCSHSSASRRCRAAAAAAAAAPLALPLHAASVATTFRQSFHAFCASAHPGGGWWGAAVACRIGGRQKLSSSSSAAAAAVATEGGELWGSLRRSLERLGSLTLESD